MWIQIKIELTTFLIIRLLIIFDKLSLSNYPLTHSQFFNLNMQILWVRDDLVNTYFGGDVGHTYDRIDVTA